MLLRPIMKLMQSVATSEGCGNCGVLGYITTKYGALQLVRLLSLSDFDLAGSLYCRNWSTAGCATTSCSSYKAACLRTSQTPSTMDLSVYNPDTAIPNLSGKVILVTGGASH
jgi:hypothetical protein